MDLFILKSWMQARFVFCSDERGANLVEYGFLLAFVALVAIVAVRVLGTDVSNKFDSVASQVK